MHVFEILGHLVRQDHPQSPEFSHTAMAATGCLFFFSHYFYSVLHDLVDRDEKDRW